MQKDIIKVALADDHILLRDALAALINGFTGCRVIFTAGNGQEVIDKIKQQSPPDILILDLNMPEVNGYDTTIWLQKYYPEVQVLMLTMYDSDLTLIRLLQAGVKGFLKKDVHPNELLLAIQSVRNKGFYYSHATSGQLANLVRNRPDAEAYRKVNLNDLEIQFLKMCCSELPYKEIAETMKLSPRAVDALRESLFDKLGLKSRVGLAMHALQHGLVHF